MKAIKFMAQFIRYSIYRLELPLFGCGACRLICLDKATIRSILSRWRKNSFVTKRMPYEKLYREFLGELERSITTYWDPCLGYKRAKFIKREKQ